MHRPLLRRCGPVAALLCAVLAISCSDVTGPSNSGARFARGLSIQPVFAGLQSQPGVSAFDLVPFNRVRLVLHHQDGSLALDTLIIFPDDATELRLALDIKLLPTAPEAGEPLT